MLCSKASSHQNRARAEQGSGDAMWLFSLLNVAVIKRCLDNETIVISDSPQFSSDWFHVRLLWRDSAMMRYDARWVIWQYQDHYLLTETLMDIQQREECCLITLPR